MICFLGYCTKIPGICGKFSGYLRKFLGKYKISMPSCNIVLRDGSGFLFSLSLSRPVAGWWGRGWGGVGVGFVSGARHRHAPLLAPPLPNPPPPSSCGPFLSFFLFLFLLGSGWQLGQAASGACLEGPGAGT